MPDRDVVPGLSAEADGPFFISPLSDRQVEVLAMAAHGFTALEIARRLQISAHTVRQHLGAVRELLGAANTTHAVAIALACGLISIDDFWRGTWRRLGMYPQCGGGRCKSRK